MRRIIAVLGLILFSQFALAKVDKLDRVVAIVNNKIITESELEKQTELFTQNLRGQGQDVEDPKALSKQVLEHLIMQEAQLQIAERSGIHIDDGMLTKVVQNFAKENNMSLKDFIDQLQAEGVEYELYRQTIRKQLAIQQLQQRDIFNSIQVSDQDIQQFLTSPNGLGAMNYEYHLGHILIPSGENPSPEELDRAKSKADEIYNSLKEGADFNQIAIKTSTSDLALKGGDLGWRKLGEMPTIFVNIVPGLTQNDVPKPIQSPSGFHIIKLLEKRDAEPMELMVTKYNVRHILIQTNDYISDNEAKTKLSVIKEQIKSGEDFENLAKTHSNDLSSSAKGGNLGWITTDVLVKEFSDMLVQSPVGVISEPFQTSFGWHILELLDKKTENDNQSAMKQKAREMIHQRKFEERLQAWQNQLRDEAYVKILL